MPGHGFYHGLAEDGQLAGQCFVDDYAHRVDVGTSIELLTHTLLRTHVDWAAADFTGLRQALSAFGVGIHQFGNAEVHDFDKVFFLVVINQNDIAGFQIAMHNTLFMGMVKGVTRLSDNFDCALNSNLTIALNEVGKGCAFQIIHDDIGQPLRGDAEVIDSDYMPMVDAAGRFTLLVKALNAERIGNQLALEHFDRDNAIHQRVAGSIDNAHAARAEHGLDFIFASQRSAD